MSQPEPRHSNRGDGPRTDRVSNPAVPHAPWNAIIGYVIATSAVVLALIVRLLLNPVLGSDRPYLTLFGAVAFAAWFTRWRPAAFAALIGFLGANYYLGESRSGFNFNSYFFVEFAGYALSTGFIILFGELLHRAREHAWDNHELLHITLASIGDGVIVSDVQGRVRFLNGEAERLTGWNSADAAGQSLTHVFRIVNEVTRQPVENPVEKVLHTGKVVGLANHTVLLAKDGSEVPIDDSAAPIQGPGRPLYGVVLVFRDVSEQRAAHRDKARLAAIVESSGDAILSKDLNGVIQTWNKGAQRLFGYQPDEIIGKPVTAIIPEDRIDEEKEIVEKLRKGQPSELLETVRLTNDGRRVPVLLSVWAIRDAEGHIIGASKTIHDMTERIAAREALIREKELLATTLASIGDGVIVTDVQGRVTFLNGEAEHLTGWLNDDASGRPLTEVFHIINEQTRQPVESPVDKVLRLGTVVGLANHTVLIAKDGREVPIDDSGAPIRHPGGDLLGVVLVFRDFSQQKESEAALQTLSLIPAQNPSPILRVAADGTLLYANPAALTHMRDWKLSVGQRAPAPLCSLASEALKSKDTSLHEIEVSNRLFLVSVVPLVHLGYANLYWADVSERVAAEHALRNSEARYRTLFEVALHGVIAIDEFGIIQSVNPAAERLFGYKQAELVGSNINLLMPEPYKSAHGSYLDNYRRTGERKIIGIGREVVGQRRDGSLFPMDLAVSEYQLDQKRYFKGIVNDITERKNAENTLRESEARERAARTEAEQAGRVKDEFLAMLSHELRTPLNAILGWSRLIDRSPADLDTVIEGIQVITRNARIQADLIADLLDVSRIMSGKLRLQFEDVNLTEVVTAAIDAVRHSADAKQIRIEPVLSPIFDAVRGDPGRLQQVVWNLLSNAVKFTPKGGHIHVELARKGSQVEIAVSDTGIGIKAEFLPHLFERFRQADASASRQHGGLGLGLAIVHHLVELHGGAVRAESGGEGQGATFTVQLPLAQTREGLESIEQGHERRREDPRFAAGDDVDLRGVRVLAIDDQADARELFSRVLEECHAMVTLASSSDEGLQALQEHRPDVVLCDIGMPGKDGYEFIKQMRSQGHTTPALAVTAFARPEDRLRALRAGYQGHITKPLEPVELVTTVAVFAKGNQRRDHEMDGQPL